MRKNLDSNLQDIRKWMKAEATPCDEIPRALILATAKFTKVGMKKQSLNMDNDDQNPWKLTR